VYQALATLVDEHFWQDAVTTYESTGNSTLLDARMDEYLLGLAHEASYRLFSSATLVLYYLRTRQAAANIRSIVVGKNTNIQDNSILLSRDSDVAIGAESTLGHNVTLTDAIVGDRSLIGIGAVLAPGTVVGDDVLVAAGARTSEGQILEAGSFYAGNPAVRRGALDDRKRRIIATTWPTYCDYARDFDAEQSKEMVRQD